LPALFGGYVLYDNDTDNDTDNDNDNDTDSAGDRDSDSDSAHANARAGNGNASDSGNESGEPRQSAPPVGQPEAPVCEDFNFRPM
jgi:hypothetical protein